MTTTQSLAAAIASARDGRTDQARALLTASMKAVDRYSLPMGFVVKALRQIGSTELADWVFDQAVSRGLDVTAMTPRFETALSGADPAAARALCRAYEAVFAQGTVNAGMLGRYSVALSRAGEWERMAQLFPPGLTIQETLLSQVPGFASLQDFNDALILEISEGAPRQRLVGRNHMQDAIRYRDVQKLVGPSVAALIQEVGRAFDTFAERFPVASSSPWARMRPTAPNLFAWANFYEAGGFVQPHLHQEGWLVAVYYPRVPDVIDGPNDAGALRVERPQHLGALADPNGGPGWPEKTIVTKAGLLVVMPAYCYHRSIPFSGVGQRVAVTIDRNIDRLA